MRTHLLLPLGAAIALGGLAAAGPAQTPATLPKPELKEWQLGNGLDVIYVGVHKAPVVTVQVWYHAGSKDEPRDRRGSAHMFEHMMFKGTEHVPPEEHARLVDRVGGSDNAFTTSRSFFTMSGRKRRWRIRSASSMTAKSRYALGSVSW